MRLGVLALWASPLLAQPLLQKAESLFKQGSYPLALTFYDSLLRIQTMPAALRLQIYLRGAKAWEKIEKPREALGWIAPAETLALQQKDTLSYIEILVWKAAYHIQRRAYSEAEAILHQASSLLERRGFQKSLLHAALERRRGLLAIDLGKYEEAVGHLHRAAQILEALGLREHPEYASVLHIWAVLHRRKGHYTQAESLYLQSKALRERLLHPEHPEYAGLLMDLANVYYMQGRYAEAEALYMQARAIWAKALGTEYLSYAGLLNNLAIICYTRGQYGEAEGLWLEAKAIWAKLLGVEAPPYARTLHNLASLYYEQGRYAEAEALYLEAKGIEAKVLGTEHPEYAAVLSNLAALYSTQGRYEEAEALYLAVERTQSKALGKEHPEYAATLNNLANIYKTQGRYAEAESLYLEAKSIQAKAVGTNHPDYASTLNNLASLYEAQGQYMKAESLYLAAKEIWAKVLDPEHPVHHYYALYNLARLYQYQRRYREADSLWRAFILRSFAHIRRELPTLPTAARQKLLENRLQSQFVTFQGYVAERRESSELVELGYRAARSFKGILLTSTEAMKYLVEASQDSALRARYYQWKRLANLYAFFTLQENYRSADSLWEHLQEVERAIVQRIPMLKDFLPNPTEEPLLPPLRSDEALVEVIRVASKKDSLLYLFYLLLPSRRRHHLRLYVHAVDASWEQRVENSYEILRSPNSVVSGAPYRLLWSFLDSLIPPKVRTVYFAPDGAYYRMNVAALYDKQRKEFVADKYQVRYIASSRRLLLKRGHFPTKPPVVMGNPDFSAQSDSLLEGRIRGYRLFERGIPSLPGAEAEAKGIAQLLGVQAAVGKAATEGFLKQLQSPQILHVATHGYFMGVEKNPLSAGGLLLAQAAVWDSLFPPLGEEDGRLTAQEASNLNLIGTELVVLSACETGLGEVRGEGLYGLQRAFLEAGAHRVITALWQIDDEATQELMLSFYKNWIKRKQKEEVDEVFSRTLKAFRQKYPHPYYWGAFVVMR